MLNLIFILFGGESNGKGGVFKELLEEEILGEERMFKANSFPNFGAMIEKSSISQAKRERAWNNKVK